MAQSGAAIFHRFVLSAGYHGQHRAAHAGSLFGHRDLKLTIQNIGKYSLPQGGFRTAAADLTGIDGDTQTSRHLDAVPDGKGHTFQNGLNHVCSHCVHGHADLRWYH